MPSSLIPSFVLYCAVSAVTPGPANLCSMAAAMRYGRRRALRQWQGLFLGFAVVSLTASVVVWSLGAALDRYVRVLAWIGAAYILWLAWHVLRSGGPGEVDAEGPCGPLTGLLLQLTNGKIIVFCVTALTVYALPYADRYGDVLKIAAVLPFTGPTANLLWLFAGASMRRLFQTYRRPLSVLMALALASCAVSIVLS